MSATRYGVRSNRSAARGYCREREAPKFRGDEIGIALIVQHFA